jgi:hypothetical protein
MALPQNGNWLLLLLPPFDVLQVYYQGKKAIDYMADFFFFDMLHVSGSIALSVCCVCHLLYAPRGHLAPLWFARH